jgi:hypothetical protein
MIIIKLILSIIGTVNFNFYIKILGNLKEICLKKLNNYNLVLIKYHR